MGAKERYRGDGGGDGQVTRKGHGNTRHVRKTPQRAHAGGQPGG